MWLLVDFLAQERIGVIETRKKPRITLSRFLDWLEQELEHSCSTRSGSAFPELHHYRKTGLLG